jgi:hypothetical protein
MTYSPRQLNLFQRLWVQVSGYIASTFQGSQRPLATTAIRNTATTIGRNYDLEIQELPIRDRERASILIQMREYCPEIGTAIAYIKDDCISSEDGDDQGVAITGLIDPDGKELPIDEDVRKAATECIERCFGDDQIELAIDRILSYGDCFANLDINLATKQVNKLLFLPTWELFRVEDRGNLIRFEQRRWLGQEPAEIEFHPINVVHWRYNTKTLYGKALFDESREDWGKLMDASMDLATAARDVGINAIVHSFPQTVTKESADNYIRDHEEKIASGIITNYYAYGGIEVGRIGNNNPDLKALLDNMKSWQVRIAVRSRLPLYLFGLQGNSAKDISGQPALAYSRFINSIRRCVGKGIRQVIDTDLALKGIPRERWQYQISWPRFITTINQANDEGPQSDTEGPSSGGDSEENKQTMPRLRAV